MASNPDMSIGRRSFLAGVSGAAAVGLPASVSRALAEAAQPGPEILAQALPIPPALDELECSTFEARIGDWFAMEHSDGNWIPVDLVEAVPAPPRFVPDPVDFAPARRPFSLTFRAAGQPRLPQAVYALQHPVLGELPLFLVPVGPDQGNLTTDYQAVFG